MEILKMAPDNIEALTNLMLELWPECNFEEEFANCQRILSSATEACFLAKEKEKFVAFIQLSVRSEYVDGATTTPVAYLEGIYVKPAFRNTCIGKKLVEFGENWGKSKGCKQFASDAELHNKNSINFHKKIGFREVNRVVSFIKEIEK